MNRLLVAVIFLIVLVFGTSMLLAARAHNENRGTPWEDGTEPSMHRQSDKRVPKLSLV
jgi:NADH:ubiquinone oxidoreductase subunit 3 (subunit A)